MKRDYRHECALRNLDKVREYIGSDVLNDWELDFLLNVLENERLTQTRCELTNREFNKLYEIAEAVSKRNFMRLSA